MRIIEIENRKFVVLHGHTPLDGSARELLTAVPIDTEIVEVEQNFKTGTIISIEKVVINHD
jgi:hypothetical protein